MQVWWGPVSLVTGGSTRVKQIQSTHFTLQANGNDQVRDHLIIM